MARDVAAGALRNVFVPTAFDLRHYAALPGIREIVLRKSGSYPVNSAGLVTEGAAIGQTIDRSGGIGYEPSRTGFLCATCGRQIDTLLRIDRFQLTHQCRARDIRSNNAGSEVVWKLVGQ